MLYLLPRKQYVDVKSSQWWGCGDGKIITGGVAEENFPLSEISNTLGLNPKTMLMKARKHLEQRDYCFSETKISIYIFPRFTTKDNRTLRMREHLQYQRFRVSHCSLPAYPPTCVSSNLCISTILTPTLTHSQAFVLMSPLPNHLSVTLPPHLNLLSCIHLFSSPGSRCWVAVFTPPHTPRSRPSLSRKPSLPFPL